MNQKQFKKVISKTIELLPKHEFSCNSLRYALEKLKLEPSYDATLENEIFKLYDEYVHQGTHPFSSDGYEGVLFDRDFRLVVLQNFQEEVIAAGLLRKIK